MGNSLHNKIHLGRRSLLASRALRTAVGLGIAASIVFVWMGLGTWR